MARARRIKATPNEADLAAAIGITVERYRRDTFARDKPVVIAGTISHPTRRQSRVQQVLALKWTDDAGAASLALYEALSEASGYGHLRSCCDNSPRGGGDMPGKVIRARAELARIRNRVVADGLLLADLVVTDAVLQSIETMEDATQGLIPGGRDRRMAEARGSVRRTAAAMVEVFSSRRAA